MARRSVIDQKDFRRVKKKLESLTDKEVLAEILGEKKPLREIVKRVIGSARAGIGPGNKIYKSYSKGYQKKIDKSGKTKFWLTGIGETGKSSGMLSEKNFSIKYTGGKIWFVWSGDQEYAKYHQDGSGKIPMRKWMHFRNTGNTGGLRKALRITENLLAIRFNNKNRTSLK